MSAPAFEINPPPSTHHHLILFARPPEELEFLYEGVKRCIPPPAGVISVVPAGSPHRVRSSGNKDELHIHLSPGLVGQVAAEAFGLDPARLAVPPLDALDLPQLRAAMMAADAELTAGAAGGRLAAESLANVLAVHLIRHVLLLAGPSAGRTAPCRRVGSAPSSSTSRNTSTRSRPWSSWQRLFDSAPTTSRGSSRQPPGCPRTSTSSCAASSGPGSSWTRAVTSHWQQSGCVSDSRIRASSPITSSAWSASPRDSSERPQESHKREQAGPRVRTVSPLGFRHDRGCVSPEP